MKRPKSWTYSQLVGWIRWRMMASRLTQLELAERVGCSPRSLGRLMSHNERLVRTEAHELKRFCSLALRRTVKQLGGTLGHDGFGWFVTLTGTDELARLPAVMAFYVDGHRIETYSAKMYVAEIRALAGVKPGRTLTHEGKGLYLSKSIRVVDKRFVTTSKLAV